MPRLIEFCNAHSAAGLGLLFSGVWQSTVLASVIALVAYGLRRAPPELRYWLWQIVPLKLLALFVWTWTLPVALPEAWVPQSITLSSPPAVATAMTSRSRSIRRGSATATYTPAMPMAKAVPATKVADARRVAGSRPPAVESQILPAFTWQSWLMLAWGAAVLLQLARLALQRRRLSKLLAAAEVADGPLVDVIQRAARQLERVAPPATLLTDQDCSPFVCGLLRPRLVLPRSLVKTLTSAELAQVVLHELAHVKRRDLLWGWLAEMARVTYFFHPVVPWVGARIRLERELACDHLAIMHSGGTAADYAAMLVRVLTTASRPGVFRAVAAAGLDGGEPIDSDLRAVPPKPPE